jgi:hypothetical protein
VAVRQCDSETVNTNSVAVRQCDGETVNTSEHKRKQMEKHLISPGGAH